MLLAIDAGNTNIVCALVEDGEIRTRWRIATDPRRTADEYAVWLHQLLELEGYGRGDVSQVIVGTVVPRALHNLEVLSKKYFGVDPMVAGQGKAEWPIALDVDEPQSVGADRVLNSIAAHAKHKGDLIVIDFGTATTFDAVDFSGAYKGGIYKNLREFHDRILHYHNDWIEIGMHLGALGLAAYAYLLWSWYKTFSLHRMASLGAALVSFIFLCGVTDNLVFFRQTFYLLLVLTAIGIGWQKWNNMPSPASAPPPFRS